MRGLILRLRGRDPEYPRGYRLCWHNDYEMVHVVAPVGIHWLLIVARWLYQGVEFRWPLSLQEPMPYRAKPLRWPFMRVVEGDNISAKRGHGLCWEEGPTWNVRDGQTTLHFRRYTAPIGLNLAYALYRRYGLVIPLVLLIVLLLAGCSTTQSRPVDAQCNPLCLQACPKPAQAGITWDVDPEDPAAWDALGEHVIPGLIELAEQCEVRRRACDQCLRRLDAAGIIRL